MEGVEDTMEEVREVGKEVGDARRLPLSTLAGIAISNSH